MTSQMLVETREAPARVETMLGLSGRTARHRRQARRRLDRAVAGSPATAPRCIRRGALVVDLSQSGVEPDVLAIIKAARAGAAVTVAIVNTEGSPVGRRRNTCCRSAPAPSAASPLLDPIVAIQAFHVFAESLARERGHDPDRPQGLHKVTRML